MTQLCCSKDVEMKVQVIALRNIQGSAKKTGPPAILSHCKYSENSMTELHGDWWTSFIHTVQIDLSITQ